MSVLGTTKHSSAIVLTLGNKVILYIYIALQDYRKVKEESKKTMALEVVTDGKNDKTEKND